jgi:hypothetical protein
MYLTLALKLPTDECLLSTTRWVILSMRRRVGAAPHHAVTAGLPAPPRPA